MHVEYYIYWKIEYCIYWKTNRTIFIKKYLLTSQPKFFKCQLYSTYWQFINFCVITVDYIWWLLTELFFLLKNILNSFLRKIFGRILTTTHIYRVIINTSGTAENYIYQSSQHPHTLIYSLNKHLFNVYSVLRTV